MEFNERKSLTAELTTNCRQGLQKLFYKKSLECIKGAKAHPKNCNRPIRDSGTALLQCKLIYFAEVLVDR